MNEDITPPVTKSEEMRLREEIREIDRILVSMVRGAIYTRCSVLGVVEAPNADQYIEPKMELCHHEIEIPKKLMWATLSRQKKNLQMRMRKLKK